jgi:ADP-ribosylglycohydrolase
MSSAGYVGSIVGLAVGDAMGYPAEFRRRAQILREIGPEGITGFLELKDARFSRPFIVGADHPPGTFTDDTQMSLAVAEALLAAGKGSLDELMAAMCRTFMAWAHSDDNNRSPGATCLTGCENLERGAPWREAAASALWCCWQAPDDFRRGVLLAVNTDGDSDSIACIVGSTLGARLGIEAIPADWIRDVERSAELLSLGEQLYRERV